MPVRRVGAAVLITCTVTLVGGCAQSASTGPGSYESAYQASRFSAAYLEASRAAQTGPSAQRDRAALVAGLSARALERDDDATRWLEPLTTNPDRAIAGRAAAALGLMAAEREDHERAAAFLSQAATQLQGDESARAALRAGDAHQALGRTRAARLEYNVGLGRAEDLALRKALSERLAKTTYTVQLGAYANLSNAESLAVSLSPMCERLGFGTPRVVESIDDSGRRLFLVQVGQFTSRTAAIRANERLGRDGVIAAAPIED